MRIGAASRWAHKAGLPLALSILFAIMFVVPLLAGSVLAEGRSPVRSKPANAVFIPLLWNSAAVPSGSAQSKPTATRLLLSSPTRQTIVEDLPTQVIEPAPLPIEFIVPVDIIPLRETSAAVSPTPTLEPVPTPDHIASIETLYRTASIEISSSAGNGAPTATPETVQPNVAIGPTATPYDLKPEVDHSLKPPNLGMVEYTVVEGDTVSGIAKQFGLKQSTIIWANPALQKDPELLRIGQKLWIPPIDGIVHTVVAGDTLLTIARKYSVDMYDILFCYYNDIEDPNALRVGERILVPGGKPPALQPSRVVFSTSKRPADAPTGSGTLIWPTKGYITQRYKVTHRAIDIGNTKGTRIVAADAGYVIRSGWDNSGYGNMIVIDHGNGMHTLYAHLDSLLVEAGASVTQGQVIGTMGKTGRATGVHLHFEVLVNGVRRNPLEYLP